MTITAQLPPPPITRDDIDRAAARTSYNPLTQEIFEFPPESSLPLLDGLDAAAAALLIELDWANIVNAIYGPQNGLPWHCNRPRSRFESCRPGDRAEAVAWYIVPERPGRAAWASCQAHLPAELPARHWYSVAQGVGNGNAQAAIKILSVMQAERRRIASWRVAPGGDEFAAYYQARLDIARPAFNARLTRLNGGKSHIAGPPESLPPLNDDYDSSMLWLARGEDRPPAVPAAAAAEQAGVDGVCPTCGNPPPPPSFTARLRALAGV